MSEETNKYCFMHTQKVACVPQCMAYTGTPENPKCLLLEGVVAITKVVTGQTMTVRHPVSAPPPEVR